MLYVKYNHNQLIHIVLLIITWFVSSRKIRPTVVNMWVLRTEILSR